MVSICVVSIDSRFDDLAKTLSAALGAPYELSIISKKKEDQFNFLKNFDLFLDVGESLVLRNQQGLSFSIDFDKNKSNS